MFDFMVVGMLIKTYIEEWTR